MFLESARVRALARASVPRVRALAHASVPRVRALALASASAITRECTASTRLGGREQQGARRRECGAGSEDERAEARGSEKIARGRLGEENTNP